ncbi:PREDICTED: increased DNA methylation 1 [Prunus dulcis]|uniref:PREDICTED: increased DNA methylation 1 n=1 Tax=Prunus dulcis TaxID=3755 RepID=A0A5E4EZI8_PRUDU|nr:uncharacterized protein LOC117625470 [Prunus dulcis]XP_034212915.1 uncharacterized protein LOC117625470 [Prunus dulcis]VVA20896.1 PREDICTED: increased DNA methylation 1 [Prunus dulcis]
MDEGVRSVGPSGVLVKNRNSSGCLIVRKKPDGLSGGVGSSSSRKVFEPKKEKKRSRLVLSDSGSSDEIMVPPPPRRKVGSETLRVCNGLRALDKGAVEGSEVGQKRERLEHARRDEDGMIGKSFLDESGGKRSKLEVFEFDEYDAEIMRRKRFNDGVVDFGGRRFSGSQSGIKREFETSSGRHAVDKRKNLYFDRTSSLNRGDHTDRGSFEMNRDGAQLPLLRDKFMGQSEESIRLQGKNGVLKVMVKKKNNLGGPLENYNFHKSKESRKAPRSEDIAKNVIVPPFYSEPKLLEKPVSVVRTEKNHVNLRKSLPTKSSKGSDSDSEDSDTSLKLGPKNVEASKPMKRAVCKDEDAPSCEKTPPIRIKEGKVRRGSGTEKQKLRERIREMLLTAGWTIDYRPRRNRDYLDAVYINPAGTAYWSIIKAYDALQKQLNEENEAKRSAEGSSFSPITDDVLSQLTRKTRKKIEKEMKKKHRVDADSENARGVRIKRSSSVKHDPDSMDSVSYEEKLSSYLKQGGKSFKGKMNENGFASVNSNGQNSSHHLHDSVEKPSSGSSSHMPHGRKSRKLGRCTLLVRGSKQGANSESDGYVPYTGKRTLLSWLIDSGTVQLSQKVQYMNRRRTKVMLEGWITRDGIHCGCCSKILTISKFEIHAGSKLRQPFQNICLDSGVSLLQCQIDAWNRQEDIERIGFHCVQVDGDDPDDDTCGLCGDGGDLICCDSCPSTFHQSCLNIQMLPPGDWHCPNCRCKFCGIASENVAEEDDTTVSALLTCSLCGKKSHISCSQEMDASPADSPCLGSSFCGQKCRELFENLKKYLGVKHELEAGFSWTLVHRTDEDQGFPQRVESNSKLAVALTVMDECFLPIVDRRSGINLIHNVLYNCGSNFNRLNYGGFYTAILERGDEIISAASIRFHGTKLAEMPFIGTRHIYRRQGMCRRLFYAIESALCSLKVEKLIIPAIAELMHTWTEVFGFISIEESFKQEMRSMNMLVFPGIDMLQKLLADQENEGNMTANTDLKQMDCEGKDCIKPGGGSKSDIGSPASLDGHGSDEAGLRPINETVDEAAATDSGSRRIRVSLNDTPVMSGSLDASDELKNLDSTERSISSDSASGAELAGSTFDKEFPPINTSHEALETENKPVLDYPVEDKMQSTSQGAGASLNNTSMLSSRSSDASNERNIQVSNKGTTSSDSDSETKSAEYASDAKCQSHPDTGHNKKVEIESILDSSLKENSSKSLEEGALDDSCEDDSHEENVDVACLEPINSSGETFAKNTKEEANGNPDSSFCDANESSLPNKCDLDIQFDRETKNESCVASEVASDAMDCEKSLPQASSDGSRTDSGKAESGSL